jgi:hypothetical protein
VSSARERIPGYDNAEFYQRVADFMRRNPAGCCLHIVLDDGNTDDSDVEFCRKEAVAKGHAECEAIANGLAARSKTQRKRACSL